VSGVYTVCGNYVTPALPRKQWYNWCYTVDALDAAGAPAMAGIKVMAEVSSSLQIDSQSTHLMPTADAFAAVHPDDIPWIPELCQASPDEVKQNAEHEEAVFSAGTAIPEFLICGTLEDYTCGSHLMEGYGPWSALLALQTYFRGEGHEFFLAGVHPGAYEFSPSLVFADAVSTSRPMMEMTARETWGVTR
jgi:hypothetical protein